MPSILIADDEPAVRGLMQNLLVSAGHDVVCAADGVEATRLLAEREFDLLIADMLMPRRDGVEVLLESRRAHPGLRIIAMSGGGRIQPDVYLRIAHNLKVDATLEKPFTKECLMARVDEALASPVSPRER